jgi:hypothetical protein
MWVFSFFPLNYGSDVISDAFFNYTKILSILAAFLLKHKIVEKESLAV